MKKMNLVGFISVGFAQNTIHDFQNTVLNSKWHCLRQMPQKQGLTPELLGHTDPRTTPTKSWTCYNWKHMWVKIKCGCRKVICPLDEQKQGGGGGERNEAVITIIFVPFIYRVLKGFFLQMVQNLETVFWLWRLNKRFGFYVAQCWSIVLVTCRFQVRASINPLDISLECPCNWARQFRVLT